MAHQTPCFSALFQQLGLEGSELGVLRFIRRHRPLDPGVALQQAPFWTPAQAAVLWKLRRRSPRWCGVLEQLEAALHGQPRHQQESA